MHFFTDILEFLDLLAPGLDVASVALLIPLSILQRVSLSISTVGQLAVIGLHEVHLSAQELDFLIHFLLLGIILIQSSVDLVDLSVEIIHEFLGIIVVSLQSLHYIIQDRRKS